MHKEHIIMVGPSRKVKGGISSIVNFYFETDLAKKYKISYIASHVDKTKMEKLVIFIKSLFIYIYMLLTVPAKIIHIHTASRASFYRKSFFVIIGKIFRKKIILHVHGAEFNIFYHNESNLFIKTFIRKIFNISNCIIALSSNWKDDLIKIMNSKKEVIVIPNGIKIPVCQKKNKKNRSNIKVLFMGRLGQRKGIYDLLKVIPSVIRRCPNTQFILAGDGDVERVKQIISDKEISDNVNVPGWISDKDNYYRQSDIFLLPSYNEGLPMSVLEAASYGLPIISTNVGGTKDVVQDRKNGFLIKPGDTAALYESLTQLIMNPNLRNAMGAKSFEIAKKSFDINKIVKKVDVIYQTLSNP